MSSELHELMNSHRDELSGTVVAQLRSSASPHYKGMDPGDLQQRADRLVAAFVDSLAERPAVFVDYIGGIAAERLDEGYLLREIQSALNILEEKAWNLVVENLPQPDQVRHLGRVTGTVGAAKDSLAVIYLERTERAESRVARLEKKIEEMFKGTDAGPLSGDEL